MERIWHEGNYTCMLFNSKDEADSLIMELERKGVDYRGGYQGGGYVLKYKTFKLYL